MARAREIDKIIRLYEKWRIAKMRCDITFKEISLYLDGRYKGTQKKDMEEHILTCPACKKQLDRASLLKASLQNLAPVKESEGFDFEFNRLLQERLAKRRTWVWIWDITERAFAGIRDAAVFPAPAFVKVAASFVVVIAVVSGLRTTAMLRVPAVEFAAGDVKIYRAPHAKEIAPRVNMRFKRGDKIEMGEGAILNIASKGLYRARIKDKSLIVLSQLNSGWRHIDANFSISHGNLLVNTTRHFKGSKMKIRTPACNTEVVGTAFMVKVSPEPENKTWLGVLKGRVKVLSKVHPLKAAEMKELAAYVSSGQKINIKPYSYPTIPELFSEKEWQMVQELYQLTDMPKVILVIGTEPNRIEELLKPAPVYIPHIMHRDVPRQIEVLVESIIGATRESRAAQLRKSIEKLEQLLEKYPNPKYNVEILMFIASHYHYLNDYENAIRIFNKVIKEYPESSLASLAQCAVGTIYQKDLKDAQRAEEVYRQLLSIYPDSIDAMRAKENLAVMGR